MKKTLLTGLGLYFFCFLFGQSQFDKLNKISGVLDHIKTASYFSIFSYTAPYDSLTFGTDERLVNMYVNPADPFLGVSFSTSSIGNQTKFDECYDGIYMVKFNWDNRSALVDTVSLHPNKRGLAPFFINVKSLIMYAKKNYDSCIINFQDFQDSIKISFCFNNKIVEFNGLTESIEESIGKVSRYELMVSKDYFPYRYKRIMPHQISWEYCKDVKVTDYCDYEFSALRQIPVDFLIKGHVTKINTSALEGKVAADWKLKEIHGDSLSLKDIKSKVLLLQFTGIGCGPCHASLPFFKKLADDYKAKNVELISIESWSDNIAGMERYKDQNGIFWKFLVAKKEFKEAYMLQVVPTFFILDEKRVIRKVIVGYKEGETDDEIIKVVNGLI